MKLVTFARCYLCLKKIVKVFDGKIDTWSTLWTCPYSSLSWETEIQHMVLQSIMVLILALDFLFLFQPIWSTISHDPFRIHYEICLNLCFIQGFVLSAPATISHDNQKKMLLKTLLIINFINVFSMNSLWTTLY